MHPWKEIHSKRTEKKLRIRSNHCNMNCAGSSQGRNSCSFKCKHELFLLLIKCWRKKSKDHIVKTCAESLSPTHPPNMPKAGVAHLLTWFKLGCTFVQSPAIINIKQIVLYVIAWLWKTFMDLNIVCTNLKREIEGSFGGLMSPFRFSGF